MLGSSKGEEGPCLLIAEKQATIHKGPVPQQSSNKNSPFLPMLAAHNPFLFLDKRQQISLVLYTEQHWGFHHHCWRIPFLVLLQKMVLLYKGHGFYNNPPEQDQHG